jgi:chitin disaccharide deacetylase
MILCADDYGLRQDINRAILELVESGRLSAVSCMVALEDCAPAALAQLLAHQDRIDLGLHLCLTTEDQPLSASLALRGAPPACSSFGVLLRRALRGQVQPQEIVRQISAQYELFVQKCGRRPDYIDGHLHAHQLPGVSDGLVEFALSLPTGCRPYVRNTRLPMRALWRRRLPFAKASFIGFFGARLFRQLRAAGVATNDGFAGIYDFRRWRRYGEYLPRFVACLPRPNGILVTHPGHEEDWRQREFDTVRKFPFVAGSLNRFQRPGLVEEAPSGKT